MKRTKFLMRLMAVMMLTVMLVSAFAVSTSAAAVSDTPQAISACDTSDDVCTKLKNHFGATSTVQVATVESSTCKYPYEITLASGEKTVVYLSQKPTTADVGVSMDDDGRLLVDGISSDDQSAWNQLFARFKGVIVGVTGVGTLVMIVLFIIQFMKLGASAGNPQARSQALTGVLWTGIAAALLGSVTIVVGFFYNAL